MASNNHSHNSHNQGALTRVSRRKKGFPAHLANDFVGDKPKSYCPGCDMYVNEIGVVCVKCDAYWHYQCAKVTAEEVAKLGDVEFSCYIHEKVDSVAT